MHPLATTPVFSRSSHLLLYPIDRMRMRRIVKSIRPDVLHAHYVTDCGLRAADTGFHPLFMTVWGSDVLVDPKRNLAVRWGVTRALHAADMVTCDATHIVPAIRSLAGPDADIRIVNFGIDTRLFCPGEADPALKKELNLEGKRVVISTRSLRPIYDIATLIRSVPLITGAMPNVQFVIIGGGPEADNLRGLASSLGVADRIRFVGPVPNDRLSAYLRTADVYVSTSLSDAGIAASTAEAMACGLPVVISDFGDNRGWIPDGGGFLFPCGEHKALAESLCRVLGDSRMRSTAASVNRQVVLERCDREIEMLKMEQYYRDLALFGARR